MSAWEELLRMCNLDITLTITRKDWEKAFDSVIKKAGKGDGGSLSRKDWQDLKADAEIFTFIAGTDGQQAEIGKSTWKSSFERNKDQIVGAKTKLEIKKLLRSLSLEQYFADALSQESLVDEANMERPLAGFFNLQVPHVKQLVEGAMPKIEQKMNETIKHFRDAQKKAEEKSSSNAGSRYTAVMQGKELGDFYKGVTGIVGEPDIDLKEGMRKEHEVLDLGAEVKFTTNNYGITTDPKTEHKLIAEYEGPGGSNVKVEGTRRCKADGISKEAKVRVCCSRDPFWSAAIEAVDLEVGLSGIVCGIMEEGHALIKFDDKTVTVFRKVRKEHFVNLDGMQKADDVREGAKVKVLSTFKSDAVAAVSLKEGDEGVVVDLAGTKADGHALIKFSAYAMVKHVHEGKPTANIESIPKDDVRTIHPIKYFLDKQWVRQARLTWHEVVAVVLYTGPMFMLYNGILRGFGNCGAVDGDVAFWGQGFGDQLKKKSIAVRVKETRNWYSSTIHCLSSAVKKLQGLNSGVQGTWLYRGLGGLDISDFLTSNGFTEPAFTSTTKDMKIALQYSGIKDGKAGNVLAVEMSEVDQGAELMEFSQYPAEAETLWNSCSYMEGMKGKEEWRITEWGPVKVQYMKVNASGKALTVEELEARRQNIVVNMLKTLRDDICRDLKKDVEKEDFDKRARLDKFAEPGGQLKTHVQDFREKAENHIRAIVEQYDHGHANLKQLTLDNSFGRADAMARCMQEVADEGGRLPYRCELYEGSPPYGRLLINGGKAFGGDKWTPVLDGDPYGKPFEPFGGDKWKPVLDRDPKKENAGIGWVQIGDPNHLGMSHQEAHGKDVDWGDKANVPKKSPDIWCVMPRLTSQEPKWFHVNSQFAEAVSSAATMPELSKSWIRCYVEDDGKRLNEAANWDFHASPQELRSIRLRKLEATRFEKDAPAERRGAGKRNERRQEAIEEMLEGLA